MSWKTAYRSFYYETAEEPEDIVLNPDRTALLMIDVQNAYMEDKDTAEETARWQPFYTRMNETVIPNAAKLIETCRKKGVEVLHARVACHTDDGRDRSLSQKKPGLNYLLLPKNRQDAQIIDELAPKGDEIVVEKTTDSALTGTNLRLTLRNMEITDVVVAHDCCAAATMELHEAEVRTINMLYCPGATSDEVEGFIKEGT